MSYTTDDRPSPDFSTLVSKYFVFIDQIHRLSKTSVIFTSFTMNSMARTTRCHPTRRKSISVQTDRWSRVWHSWQSRGTYDIDRRVASKGRLNSLPWTVSISTYIDLWVHCFARSDNWSHSRYLERVNALIIALEGRSYNSTHSLSHSTLWK